MRSLAGSWARQPAAHFAPLRDPRLPPPPGFGHPTRPNYLCVRHRFRAPAPQSAGRSQLAQIFPLPARLFHFQLIPEASVTYDMALLFSVEMFKIQMQGQYGGEGDKRLSAVFSEMWTHWGVRKGIMRGFWVRHRNIQSCVTVGSTNSWLTVVGNRCAGNPCIRKVSDK